MSDEEIKENEVVSEEAAPKAKKTRTKKEKKPFNPKKLRFSFSEGFDKLFGFGAGESEEGDGVDPVFPGNGVVGLVFLGKAADLVHLFFGSGSDGSAHLI